MSSKILLSRRMLLVQSASMASVGLVGSTTANAAPRRRSRQRTIKTLKPVDYESALGDNFRVFGARYPVRLVLVDVKDIRCKNDKARPRKCRKAPFSLLFKAPNANKLKSGIYRFEHPVLGTHSLYLTKVRADDDPRTFHYEVIFN